MQFMERKELFFILGLCLVVFIVRLVLAFLVPNLTYESYFHVRQVEHIRETGLPLFEDDLSYGGRIHRFLPFFHYFMAFFTLFLPLDLVTKILPNLLLAMLPFIVYLIAKEITTNKLAPFYSAFITGFLPILYTPNAFTIETLFLPLLFCTLYMFLRLEHKPYLYGYLFLFLLLSVTSPNTYLLLLGFGIYLLLSVIEKKIINKAEIELIIFSVFFFVWIQFLFFKDLFLQEGLAFIWQNIPSQIIQEYFPKLSITKALVLVSIIPFLTGIFVVYRSLFALKNLRSFLLISFTITTTILAWFRLIKFEFSLAFFGVILAIFFAVFYEESINYIKKTKFPKLQKSFSVAMILLLMITMIFPSFQEALQQETPSNEELLAFHWMGENLSGEGGVLALLEEGHLVTYLSKRKNLMDDQFVLIDDVDQRFKDLTILYTTSFQTQAFDLFDKYQIRYIVLTPFAKKKYDLQNFHYLAPGCFRRLFKEEIKIYEVTCSLTETNKNAP